MEKLNKKNGEKVSVQSKNQRGIFYRLKDRLKLNKKNGKKVIVQPEDQSSLAYELTNKYKLEKNKSDDMKALVALGKDLSKYAPATIEGILFYLPLTPEKKNLFQPRNRIVQPEDQQSHAYRLTNKYELKMERTNPEKFAKLGRELSRYDPATIEGILLHLPLIPEEKDLLQPRNRIVQPEDQLELADRLIDKYKLKNKHTNLKTMAALGKDLSRYDPDSTEGILLHLPLIPEEKKQLQPRNRIVQPEDQLELAYRITKKYKLKHQHTNLKTFVALGKDLSRYDPDSTEGILLHLPLIPEEKDLLQPRNRIVKPEDRLELADRLTDKYNLKMERTDPVTFAKLDRELSKYDSDSTEGILLHLPLIPEEKNLLQPSNRIVKPENQPNLAYRLTKKYKLKHQHTNVKTLVALGKELSKYDPNSTAGILLLLPLNPEEKKLLQPRNRIAQPKDQPALAYELTEEKKQSTNIETLVALDKDLSKDDPTSSEGNISNLPLNPEEKNLLQPSNRIAQPEDQPALAYELTEEKKQSTNTETLVIDKDLSKEKNLLQQRTIEMDSEDRTFFIDYLNEKHNLNSNTPLSEKTKAVLIEDLDKFYYLPLKPSTCYNFISDLHIINRDDVRELLNDQIPKVNKLITQVINNATLAITSKYQLVENQSVPKEKLEAIATEIMNLNLVEEQKREVIAKLEISKEDRATLGEIYREKQDLLQTQESQKDAEIKAATIAITTKYELSEDQSNSPEKLNKTAKKIAKLDLSDEQKREVIFELKIPEKDQDTLLSIYEEQKKAANIAIIKKYQPNAQYDLKEIAKHIANERRNNVKKKSTESEQLFQQNVNAVATTITNKHQLSEDRPATSNKLHRIANEVVNLNLNIDQKLELMRTLALAKADKDKLLNIFSNSVINDKIVSLLAEEIKVDYQLSKHKTISPKDLHEIAIIIENSYLDEKYMEKVPKALGMRREDKEALRDIIRERAKQQTEKKQENEADIKINGKTIAEVLDDNALLLSRAMDTALELKENEKVKPEILSMMAEFIGSRKLNEINRRNMPYMLTLTKEDKEELSEIINEKTTLLNKELGISQVPAKMNLSSTLSQGLNNLDSNPKDPLQTSPKPNLRTLLNQSENTPGLEPNTSPKPGTLPKAPARINLLNVVVQNKIVSLLAEEIKVNYQLSENKTTSPKDLHEIAITIENSYLDEKYMDTLSDNLVMRIEEKEALRDIIRERAKQQTDKKQENEADIKINGKTIAEVVDDNALLLSRAMNTALALNENQKVEPKMLSTMAEFIGSRKLNEINRRNIPYMLTLTKEDKKELNEIINGKTTLLSKLPELDRTNPNPIDQVPLPLNQRLSNRGSEQNTLPKPNKNIKQMNSLSQGSAEVSR
ncbi:hypothetical protein [Enterococcus hirae]|uniref:hypothetical protein n=1 Tax=Enterococcus hirae TaxID=1354 RepID=UPI001F61DF86|nr:hypothetical protein [Enterococcus hirae]MBO1089026.1 hypothetical protein [Enterococcus hirae]MEB7516624.1 hypothetical protein [Enterococcus hirae]